MSLRNRQLRALRLVQIDGQLSEGQWSRYGYTKAFVDNLAAGGYLSRNPHGLYSLTKQGVKALEKDS